MAAKTVLFVCAQVVLIQSIAGQCAGLGYNAALNAPFAADRFAADRFAADRFAADVYATERYTADRLGAPYAAPFAAPFAAPYETPLGYAASNGGALPVASSSPFPPNGVSVLSENAIEGALAVTGQLPFLGTVALEGALPTAGSGAVNFGCGNGNVGILNEDAGFGYGAGYAAGFGAPGYGFDGARRGCGCGRF